MMSSYKRVRVRSAEVCPCHRFFDIPYGASVTSKVGRLEERLQKKGILVTGTPC